MLNVYCLFIIPLLELEDELASHKTELRKVTDDNGMLTVQV